MIKNSQDGIDLTPDELAIIAEKLVVTHLENIFDSLLRWEDLPYLSEGGWDALVEELNQRARAASRRLAKKQKQSGLDPVLLLEVLGW